MSTVAVKPDEETIMDADGEILREYDDVVLLNSIPSNHAGNVFVDTIRAGTSATIIIIAGDHGFAELECYVAPKQFAFARDRGGNLRLLRRREEKLKHARH